MFNSLTGRVSGHQYPLLFLSIGGVEWELEVSASTFQALLAAPTEQDHRVFTYLHTREDILKLYGFWTERERQAFLELLSVSGIGPRQTLKILSGTNVDDLGRYLEEDDVDALTRIPGLGKKTAQRLILQLKGHLVADDTARHSTGVAGAGNSVRMELLEALTEMGFDRKQAEQALATAAGELDTDSVAPPREVEQELFRRAIVALSGS